MNVAQAKIRHLTLDVVVQGYLAYHQSMSLYVDNSALVLAHQGANNLDPDPRRIVTGLAVLVTQLSTLLDVLKVLAVAEAVPYGDVFTLEGYPPADYAAQMLAIIGEWSSDMMDESIVQDARARLNHVRDMERMVLNAQR